jgi:hypothetical protein
MGESDGLDLTPNQMMAMALFGLMALVALFALAALVRRWGRRMQKGGGTGGGLDLKELLRQRDAGLIRPEEYEAIAGRLAGRDKPSDAAGRRPINDKGPPTGGPEGSRTNGEG